jgi:hypothetical protein
MEDRNKRGLFILTVTGHPFADSPVEALNERVAGKEIRLIWDIFDYHVMVSAEKC